jgi:hypothetical protein
MFAPLISIFIALWIPAPFTVAQHNQSQVSPAPSPNQNQYESTPAKPTTAADNEQNRQAGGENKKQNKQDKQNWFDRFVDSCARNDKAAVAISTIAVAAFTLALVIATLALWWSGWRQSKNELRAYVSFSPLTVNNFIPLGAQRPLPFGATHPVEIVFTMFNHGKTPAFNVRVHADGGVFQAGLTEPPRRTPWQPRGGASIFPGASINQFFWTHTLTTEQTRDIELGTQRIYIWGTVIYRLAFRKFRSRRTWFFASVGGPQFAAANRPQPAGTPRPAWNWMFGQRHNDST